MRTGFYIILLVGAALLGSACRPAKSKGPQVQRTEVGVRYSFAEYFPSAKVHGRIDRLDLTRPQHRTSLSSGWYEPEKDDQGTTMSWTLGRDAVIDLPRVVPEDLKLTLDIRPHDPRPTLPPQKLRVAWNGKPLGPDVDLEARRQTLSFDVPTSCQLSGMNRLELMPNFWVTPRKLGQGNDDRLLGVRCYGVSLMASKAECEPTTSSTVSVRDDVIHQAPGSVISYYFKIPRAARLAGEASLKLDPKFPSSPGEGKVLLTMTDEAGKSRELGAMSLADAVAGKKIEIALDLAAEEGGMAAFSLAFSLKAGSASAQGMTLDWKGLRLEGTAGDLAAVTEKEFKRRRYNILMVLFDTLRADHTEPYGAANVQTPAIRALAESGAAMVNASSESCWTRPAVASLFTSTLPFFHGINGFGDGLAPDIQVLPDLLRSAGYRTLAVINNPQIASDAGFGRGFRTVHEVYRIHNKKMHEYHSPEDQARFVWDGYISPEIDAAKKDPFFAYVHEIDPHSPYTPMKPFDRMYDTGYRGALDVPFASEEMMSSGVTRLGAEDVAFLDSQYRGEISYMDRYLAYILDRLKERGLTEKTLVIFLSDHGEEFLEHGHMGHRHVLYEELLRVPLIFSLKGALPAGKKPHIPVQHTDIAPTILDLIGEPIPPSMRGRSFLPYLFAPDEESPERALFAEAMNKGQTSVVLGSWKIIRRRSSPDQGPSTFELYDLKKDPKETLNRWASEPIVGQVLAQALRQEEFRDAKARLTSPHRPARLKLDPETISILEHLGYIDRSSETEEGEP